MATFWTFVQAHMTFSMVVISASVLGHALKKVTLPLITGYLLTGVIAGPFVLDMIHSTYLGQLKWINEAALAVIAFCAGAELYLPDIKKLFTIIMMHVSMITVFTLTFVPIAVLAVSSAVPFLKDLSWGCRVPIAFLCGSLMLERSPSGALAMINEMMSQGPITKTLLGVTIVSDVALLTTFAVTSSFAEASCGEDGFNAFTLVSTLLTLLLCATVGYVLGKVIIFIMWLPRLPSIARGALILPIGYFVFWVSRQLEEAASEHTPLHLSLEPILCCVIASTIAGNSTSNRRQFANILHTSAPYIFIPFFCLSGANMDLYAIYKGLPFALVLVFSRMFAIASSTFLGGKFIAKESPLHYKFLWMTLLPQAGPLLGLVNEIKEYGEWARELAACCIAALIINHIVGLKLFKWGLVLVGEAFKAVPSLVGHDGGHVEVTEEELAKDRSKEIRIFGVNNISMSIIAKLTTSNFNLEVVPSKLMDSKSIQKIFSRRREELEKLTGGSIEMSLSNHFLDQNFIRKVYSDTFGPDDDENSHLIGNEERDKQLSENSLSFQSLRPLLEAICPEGCHALIFTFPFDSFNWMTCRLLSLCRKINTYNKVIVLIRDPNMAAKFEKLGVIPVYSLSTVAEIFAQMASAPHHEPKAITMDSDVNYWTKLIHESEKSTTCKLQVKDLNGDFSTLEDFDLDNLSKLNALGLADSAGSGFKFEPKFEYPLPLADTKAGGDQEINESEMRLRNKMRNVGKIFRRSTDEPNLALNADVKTEEVQAGKLSGWSRKRYEFEDVKDQPTSDPEIIDSEVPTENIQSPSAVNQSSLDDGAGAR